MYTQVFLSIFFKSKLFQHNHVAQESHLQAATGQGTHKWRTTRQSGCACAGCRRWYWAPLFDGCQVRRKRKTVQSLTAIHSMTASYLHKLPTSIEGQRLVRKEPDTRPPFQSVKLAVNQPESSRPDKTSTYYKGQHDANSNTSNIGPDIWSAAAASQTGLCTHSVSERIDRFNNVVNGPAGFQP